MKRFLFLKKISLLDQTTKTKRTSALNQLALEFKFEIKKQKHSISEINK